MRPPASHATARVSLAFLLLAGLPTLATAAPPQLTGTSPFGLTRGAVTELTLNGSNLNGNPRLVAPFAFKMEGAPEGKDAAKAVLRLSADPRTPVGIYPIRLQTDDGLSNPILLAVGQLPQVQEKEENGTFDTAQTFSAPAVIEGQAAGNDVDYFRFTGKKGQKVVVDAQCARMGSGVDPSIRLTTASRGFVASADDTPGLYTDARLFATLPQDGDYIVEISDSRYQGTGRPIYRLVVGEVPTAEEVYPIGGRLGETVGLEVRGGTLPSLGTFATQMTANPFAAAAWVRASAAALGLEGTSLDVESLRALRVSELPEIREPSDPKANPPRAAAPVVLNGRIDPEGDEDRFTLAVVPGQKYRIEVEAAEIGSALDGVLSVLNAKGDSVANADDTNIPPPPGAKAPNNQPMVSSDPSLEYTVPAGQTDITIALRDLQGRGGVGFPYRITATPVVPTFTVALNDPQISIPKGGSAAVSVGITRKGYNGPITLNVVDPPAGLTVRPGIVADGQLLGSFTVAAGPEFGTGPHVLNVVGEGKGADGPIVVKASKSIVLAQQGNFPTNSYEQRGVAAAVAQALPVNLEVSADPVEVVHGYGTTVPVKALRGKDAEGALAIATLPLPPGLTVPAGKIEEKAGEGKITVNTATDHPLGKVTLVMTGKGKVAGAERNLVAPAVTLDVVRPAAVELAAATIEVKAGSQVELKGKVLRKGPFKEPVTVKVNGLPAGVKVDPVTVAPDASEFTLKLQAEEKAAAATAGATAALAFQVNKKDYPAPTAPLSVKVLPAK